VRTRTDVETIQARNNDYTMFNAAIQSRAQILSTDYYTPDLKIGRYVVSIRNPQKPAFESFILR
jgi:hypothetical protein